MSATDWGECPICQIKKRKGFKKLQEQYGKISQEEYEKLREKIEEEHKQAEEFSEDETVREDYEIFINAEGYLSIDYSGVCQVCGASWQFNKTDILPEADEDKKLVRKLNKND